MMGIVCFTDIFTIKNVRRTVMKKISKKWLAFILAFSMLFAPLQMAPIPVNEIHASSIKKIEDDSQIICGKKGIIQVPYGYKNCSFSSSNKKVATVSTKGTVKTLRLGVTKITIKSGKEKTCYTITVIPAKKKDVYLKQKIFLTGQSGKLQLASKKYDTSQVQLTSHLIADDFNTHCYSPKIKFEGTSQFYVEYGEWDKKVSITCMSVERMMKLLLNTYTPDWQGQTIYAGESVSYKKVLFGLSPSDCNASGVQLYVDDQLLKDQITYEPGEHVFKIKSGNYEYTQKVGMHYSIKKILQTQNTNGLNADCKEVLDTMFQILNQIITPDMTDEQKVKAIHDYLIYHADYYSGDINHRPGWSSAVKGVIMEHEGVCNSYALAFYTMATAEGIPCRVISGTATNSIGSTGLHAWNQVQLDGKWYYIDCTWDDPTGGGHERTTYYLSETLWSNHVENNSKELVERDFWYWENYYLTGEKWNK